MPSATLESLLGPQSVVPLLEVDDARRAVALARILVGSGLPVMEVALRTSVALAAAQEIRASVPGAIVGVGTVVTAGALTHAIAAGAAFIVSPGSTPELLTAGVGGPVPFVPGVATVSELMRVADAGALAVKFYPAASLGGIAGVASLAVAAPSVRFLPTGGIDAGSAPDYLRNEHVFAVGGSWVCQRSLIERDAWDEIGERARAASKLARCPTA
jgi:2-dehydro-3-deoxyphosphogluconate aldolase / (4S)-4-hydroxy-2-oxoglutarate aldolase